MGGFRIYFTGRTDDGQLEGRLEIGAQVETFLSRTDRWSREKYEAQWRQGIARIASGGSPSCLITALPPAGSAEPMEWWILYRVEGDVFVQNHLRLPEPRGLALNEAQPWVDAPERVTRTPSGKPVSEWRIDLDAFEANH